MKGEDRILQLVLKQVGQLIAENEHARRVLDCLTRMGLSEVEARKEMGRVLLGVQWEVAQGRQVSLEAYLDRLMAGERAVEMWPE